MVALPPWLPVGQGAEFEASVFRANSIIIFGLKDDDITVPQYHAAHLASIFSKHPSLQYHLIEGHHSAFIAPFAERVTDIEHILAAIDPDGFARLAFLDIGVFG